MCLCLSDLLFLNLASEKLIFSCTTIFSLGTHCWDNMKIFQLFIERTKSIFDFPGFLFEKSKKFKIPKKKIYKSKKSPNTKSTLAAVTLISTFTYKDSISRFIDARFSQHFKCGMLEPLWIGFGPFRVHLVNGSTDRQTKCSDAWTMNNDHKKVFTFTWRRRSRRHINWSGRGSTVKLQAFTKLSWFSTCCCWWSWRLWSVTQALLSGKSKTFRL